MSRRSLPSLAAPHRGARRWRPAPAYLALAVVFAVGGPLLAWWSLPGEGMRGEVPAAVVARMSEPASPLPLRLQPAEATAPAAPAAVPATAVPLATVAPVALSAAAAPQIPRQRDPNGDQTPDIADFVNPGEHPTMAEVIARLHAAGVRSGLGAFSPPGTRPPLIGLAVPDDFELPAGYVRHHQATDDGQRIEPILMFSPDHRWFDAAGRPLALPSDRVVPPELAPPGLPIRRIVLPAPVEPGRPPGR